MGKPTNVDEYFEVVKKFAERKGLIFHPDEEVVRPLIEGLWTNLQRHGYPSCPCRLASGDTKEDRDIICPCEYAEPDKAEFGKCYCYLYVSQDFMDGKIDRNLNVPERRPEEKWGF